jgi:hypothetical protein
MRSVEHTVNFTPQQKKTFHERSTHVIFVPSSIFSSSPSHPILHKFKRHNKCNSWRFDSRASLLMWKHKFTREFFMWKVFLVCSLFYYLFKLKKSIKTNWKMFFFTMKPNRNMSKINSFRNCDAKEENWLIGKRANNRHEHTRPCLIGGRQGLEKMISNNHKSQ